jgi:hypothetical protein
LVFGDIVRVHPVGKHRIENIGELFTRGKILEYPNIEYPIIGLTERIESAKAIEEIPPHNTTGYG